MPPKISGPALGTASKSCQLPGSCNGGANSGARCPTPENPRHPQGRRCLMMMGTPGCSFRVLGRARFWSCAPHCKRLILCILNMVSYGFGSTRGQGPRLSIRPTGRNVFVFVRDVTHVQTCRKKGFIFQIFGSYLKHVQACDDVRVQSATQPTVSAHS